MKQVLVQNKQGLCKIVVMENGKMTEYYTERPSEIEKAGNVYKGKVVNVVPGLQAAFVDIGLDKNAYLYIDDLLPAHLEKQPEHKPSIRDLVKEGQEVIVQVKKEPVGSKGARVTTHCTIPGRWLVFLPEADYVATSRKINCPEEKTRLRQLAEALREPGDGIIVRTLAEGQSLEVLEQDFQWLKDVWSSILRKAECSTAPALLYRDLSLLPRLVRDLFNERVDEWVVDEPQVGAEIKAMLDDMAPELTERVRIYSDRTPLFEAYGISAELEAMSRRQIWLHCGGYIVVDRTEALTVIDVNTGKYTGQDNLERTAYVVNREAASLIARLIRFRDLGGIILIDFIDMEEEEHRRGVQEVLEEEVLGDRARTNLVGWTRLGLFELTRQRSRPAIDDNSRCPVCGGSGRLLSREG